MSEHWHETGAAAAYVAGDLPDDQLDAFEHHLLECAECRAQIVAGGAATAELRVAPVRVRRRRPTRRLALTAAVLTLTAFAGWREAMRLRLARVSPPEFVGGTVRAESDSTASVVDLGMQAYASANYAAAAQALARAAHSDSSPGVAFYLGAALLSAGNADSALGPLLRARVPEGNPWAAEATLLAAKVLVRLRQADSALALLDQAIAANPRAAALRAFADSVRKQ